MAKITKLTPEQEARFGEFIEKWTAIGLSTDPANRAEAERGVKLAYEIAGLTPPRIIVWCTSPLSMILTHSVVAQVGAQVGAQVVAQVGAQVWAQVGAQVWEQVGEQVGAQVRAQRRASGYGQHDANWLGFFDYFNVVLNLSSETKALAGLWLIAKNAGWWLPCANVCFISERHNILKRDTQGRLHSENSIACGYPDGWGVYAWHGVRVTEQIIMQPDTITAQQILDRDNAEVRRVMLTRYRHCEQITCELSGEALWLQDIGMKPISENEYGAVYLKIFEDDEPLCYVRVIDPSTGRVYFLRVDSSAYRNMAAREPQAAVASTWRKADGTLLFPDWRDYQPMVQT